MSKESNRDRKQEAGDISPHDEQSSKEFVWFFTKDRLRIYSFIFSMLRHTADAEEVFQQCSITLWKKFGEYDQTRDFSAWACKIAFHEVQNFRRLAVNRRVVFDDRLVQTLADEHIAAMSDDRERLDLLEECVTSLPDRDREMLVLAYRDRMQADEIARKVDRATQTIYNKLSVLRNRLLDCMNRKMSARSAMSSE